MIKSIFPIALLGVLCLTLTGCNSIQQAEQEARSGDDGGTADVLTVSIFGGNWGSAIEEHIIKPFEAETGAKVRTAESTSTLALGKMRQQGDAFDVVLLDSGVSEMARQEDLVATLQSESLSHADELDERALASDDNGLYAVTMGFWSLGLAYNTDEVHEPPTSWEDLWDPKYEGRVTIPTPATTGGLPLAVMAAGAAEGKPEGINAGLAKLSELDVAAYFDSSGSASNLLQSGEALIAAHYGPGTWPLADQGLPIAWIAPEEGSLAAESKWHIAEESRQKELALQFLDFASSVEAQSGVAEDLYVAPANTNVELSDSAKARMPYGPDGSLDDLTFSDWNQINENRSQWTQAWDEEVAR